MRVLVVVLLALLIGCDTAARLFPQRVVFLSARVVGAWPARQQGDDWVPVCEAADGEPDGLITNVALIGSLQRSVVGAPIDEDVSMRPGDLVDTRAVGGRHPFDIHLDNGSMFVELTCIDPLADPEAAPTDDPQACAGTVPSAQLAQVSYVAHVPDRLDPNEVLILIDMSGSMSGLVDAETLLEPQPELFDDIPDDLRLVASDSSARRISSAQELVRSLNPKDRVGVVLFGEQIGGGAGLLVPCGSGTGMEAQAGLRECFGINHEQWVGPASVLSMNGNRTGGRSNLWKALDAAYTFMADPERKRPDVASRHIVVLSDGPDTCNGAQQTPATSACSSVTADEVHARLGSATKDPNAPRVQVHVVQFEAPGYPGRDAEQVKVACLTRGHYRFIDTNMLREDQNQVARAFSESVLDLRFTLMGEWQIASSVSALQSTSAGTYTLGGHLVLEPESFLVPTTTRFGFAGNVAWDSRPTVVRP